MAAELGNGVPIKALREDAEALSLEEFADKHGEGFLLLTASELWEARGPAATEVQVIGIGEEPVGERTASIQLLVYSLRRGGKSAGHLVTVGRAPNNDVAIPDLSISRFHAFVKPCEDGTFMIQDASSTNGTTVNGVNVPAQGQGQAMSLKAGDNVRLGQVELTYLTPQALMEFAQQARS